MAETNPAAAARTTAGGPAGAGGVARREIRIGLVLYGGVSLAVYETGVTRTFHELVTARRRPKEGFDLLLQLLEADAVVDTISGASAGGINGMLLAAALESGAEFGDATDLWLRGADLGELLRRPATAASPASILDGEVYYQERLIDAFEKVLRRPAAGRGDCAGEIDVFVTSTDLRGSTHEVRVARDPIDGPGERIRDRTHRVVFHLKHRRGRARLGLANDVPDHLKDRVQATTLAAIARATSAFPVAFSPFHASQLARIEMPEDVRTHVRAALPWLMTLPQLVDAAAPPREGTGRAPFLMDGGVLDNKPFRPLLRAIFYRLPTGPVQRRVFFVEPDPTSEREAQDLEVPTPAQVALAALSTVPAHESILEDVASLEAHNARVGWLKKQRDVVVSSRSQRSDPALRETYRQARLESLAKSLVLAGNDGIASAEDAPPRRHRQLYADLVRLLGALRTEELDRWDVGFQLRRAFFVLYRVYGDGGAVSAQVLADLRRIIETLEVIKAGSRKVLRRLVDSTPRAEELLSRYQRWLLFADEAWGALRGAGPPYLAALHAVELEELARRLGAAPPPAAGAVSHDATALEVVSCALLELRGAGTYDFAEANAFTKVDEHLFPAEYLTGVHELDELRLVRISPRDAKLGLADLGDRQDAMVKLCGDGLGHFAGFLRSDWRANDMLWGRIDGIAQVVASLLDEEARARLAAAPGTPGRLRALFPPGALGSDGLGRAAAGLADALGAARASDAEWREFRNELALAMQQRVVAQDLARVRMEAAYQETVWRQRTIDGVGSESAPREIEDAARRVAAAATSATGEDFVRMKIGAETVGTRVPLHVLGEYAAHASLLLWGMLDASLQRRGIGVMNEPLLRLPLRAPLRTALLVFGLIRTDRRAAHTICVASLGLSVGAFVSTMVSGASLEARAVSGAILAAVLLFLGYVAYGLSFARRSAPPKGRPAHGGG